MEEDTIFLNKRITTKDVYSKLEGMEQIQTQILDHAKYTNGKIATAMQDIKHIEEKSFGCWVAKHPFKFILFILILTSVVVSDVRQPVLGLIAEFFL